MHRKSNTLRNWLKKGKRYLDELVKILKGVALEKDSIVSGLAGNRSADIFLQLIAFFYRRERQYDDEGLTPEERGTVAGTLRQISLRQYLKIEKDKDPSETTPYLRAALNYLDRFWDNIFAFLKDGNLPIDNNLAYQNFSRR